MSEDLSLNASLNALINQPAWGLARTVGSMFFLEIGQPKPRFGRKKVHGEWHFLIEMCHWRIETTKDLLIVGSDDDQQCLDRNFATLELGTVEEAWLSPAHDLHLVFNAGIRLTTFSASAMAKDETQWIFFCSDENAWSVAAGGIPVRGNIHEPRK